MSRSRYRTEDERETTASRKMTSGGNSGRGRTVSDANNQVSEVAAIIDAVAAERPTRRSS